MRMREEYVYFPQQNVGTHFYIELSGITYPDETYMIKRDNSSILVVEYVMSGEGEVTLNGKRYHVKEGDLYLLPPGTDHLYYPDREKPWTKMWFNAVGTLVNSLLWEYNPQKLVVFSGTDGKEYLEQARTLLRNTRQRVREISDSLGFCDEHYFSYIFKKKCGKTPGEYRRVGD